MIHKIVSPGTRKHSWVTPATLGCLGLFATLILSCRHNPPQTAATAAPRPEATQPQAEAPPPPTPQPAAKDTVLSEDLATMNARGYLKDAFFDFNKADLREEARTVLADDAQWLKQYPSIQVLIEGHCDERGTEEYNLSLGEKRAAAATGYLASLGIDSSRVRTVSYGKDRPLCNEHNETCWQSNRRGHFVITAK